MATGIRTNWDYRLMRKETSKKYAIYIILFSIYILLSLLDVDKNLWGLPFNNLIIFFIVIIFGLIPLGGLVNAYFFTYRLETSRDKIRIVKESFKCLKKWLSDRLITQ